MAANFQAQVEVLLKEKNTGFKGHIATAADVTEFEGAIVRSKARKNKARLDGDKSAGFPNDNQGQQVIVRRLYDAFFNMEGVQDIVSESLPNRPDCLPYQAVEDTSPIEAEIIAYKLMAAMLRVQRGDQTAFKVVQEQDYQTKVDRVVEALKYNKSLCRSAKDKQPDFIDRIAANPAGEREIKVNNQVLNNKKKTVLKNDSAARGKTRAAHGTAKARAKGKGKGKGKKRQAAEDENEDDDEEQQQQYQDTAENANVGFANEHTSGEGSQLQEPPAKRPCTHGPVILDQAAIDRTWNTSNIDQTWNTQNINPMPFDASEPYQQNALAPATVTAADPNQQFFGPVEDLQTMYGNYGFTDFDAYLVDMNDEQPSAGQEQSWPPADRLA